MDIRRDGGVRMFGEGVGIGWEQAKDARKDPCIQLEYYGLWI